MFGVAIILYIVAMFFNFDHYVIFCSINSWQAYRNEMYFRKIEWYQQATVILTGIYIIWDVITLMLYIYKIRVFTKSTHGKDDKVKNRILSILNKITIITLFYQFAGAAGGVVFYFVPHNIARDGSTYLANFLYCYSMYIMMDHNKKSYEWFLKILYRFKLYFICYCFCKKRVIEQLNYMKMIDLKICDGKSAGDHNPQIENTEYDTKMHDITVNHAKIQVQNVEFSVETAIQ